MMYLSDDIPPSMWFEYLKRKIFVIIGMFREDNIPPFIILLYRLIFYYKYFLFFPFVFLLVWNTFRYSIPYRNVYGFPTTLYQDSRPGESIVRRRISGNRNNKMYYKYLCENDFILLFFIHSAQLHLMTPRRVLSSG